MTRKSTNNVPLFFVLLNKLMNFIAQRYKFVALLVAIALFGLFLRFIKYDSIPPFTETQDEFFYPWAGMTLIKTGVPVGWSWFPSYPDRNIVVYWGATYPIVSPWVEKPPLYSIITGTAAIISGANQLNEVRLSVIRLVPVFLSFATIILVGLLAKIIFDETVGILAALLYATVPVIVMSNRLSLVENLLTPICIIALIFFSTKYFRKFSFPLIILLCGLAILTKNIGVSLPLAIGLILLLRRNWRYLIILSTVSFAFFLIHPLMGLLYDWKLFVNVLNDYRTNLATIGLPEITQAIFSFPTIGSKERLFQDGSLLAGYILFLSAPFWLKTQGFLHEEKYYLFLSFPFIYLLLLGLLESGGTQFSFFGWHVYPLFPFLMIVVARALKSIYQSGNLFMSAFFYLIIGFSSVRFLLLVFPSLKETWQYFLMTIFIFLFPTLFLKRKIVKITLLAFFGIYLFINILVVFNLDKIYTEIAQPLF